MLALYSRLHSYSFFICTTIVLVAFGFSANKRFTRNQQFWNWNWFLNILLNFFYIHYSNKLSYSSWDSFGSFCFLRKLPILLQFSIYKNRIVDYIQLFKICLCMIVTCLSTLLLLGVYIFSLYLYYFFLPAFLSLI